MSNSQDRKTRSPFDSEQSGALTEKGGLRNLFLIRRRPKLQRAKVYVRPENTTEWLNDLKGSGFFTTTDVEVFSQYSGQPLSKFKQLQDEIAYMQSAEIGADSDASYVDRINEYDTEAVYYQNIFYWYNWIFILGALATTLSGLLSILASGNEAMTVLAAAAAIVTAVTGIFTAAVSALNSRQRPQLRWYVNRRKAEALRRHYYLYLARVGPYNRPEKVRRARLQEAILQVENIGSAQSSGDTQGQSAAVLTTDSQNTIRQQLSRAELDLLVELYRERRVQRQTSWYKNRSQEFEYNSTVSLVLSAAFVAVAGLFGAVNAVDPGNWWAQLMATGMPAAAAALAAFNQVYGWDRQRRLYDDTVVQLRRAAALLGSGEGAERQSNFLLTVERCESVFAAESDQWGQGIIERELAAYDAQAAGNEFESLLKSANISDEQRREVMKIYNSVQPPSASPSSPPPSA